LVALAALAALAAPATVAADSFTPIALTVKFPATVRSDRAFSFRVSVTADPSGLDARRGPVRAAVRLTTGECGGTYDGTTGPALLNKVFSPQPNPGRAYSGTVTSSARLRSYTTYTLCTYLDDDYQQLATQIGQQTVTVSRSCTRAADTYDRALKNKHVSRSRRTSLGKAARKACGYGIAV
jgi:hypothetical protein